MTRLDAEGEAEQEDGDGGRPKNDNNALDGVSVEEKTLALLKPGVSELHLGETKQKQSRIC